MVKHPLRTYHIKYNNYMHQVVITTVSAKLPCEIRETFCIVISGRWAEGFFCSWGHALYHIHQTARAEIQL